MQVISTAEKQMKQSHQSQIKQLSLHHERECAEALKKIEAQASLEIRQPFEKDKEEKLR